jgi:hypothetical protein
LRERACNLPHHHAGRIAAIDEISGAALLDRIATGVTPTFPEPSTWAMLLIGFAD